MAEAAGGGRSARDVYRPAARAAWSHGGLLAVHAHPDDESLSTGALLATWAAAGLPVCVVTCTRGERGQVVDTPFHPTGLGRLEGDGPRLAAHRERELAGALRALGVVDHVLLDAGDDASGLGPAPERYVDSGMRWVAAGIAGPDPDPTLAGPGRAFATMPLDEAAARLASIVRARRPRVVVTYEPGGGYGHPDHVRAHDVTVRALELAADPAFDGAGASTTGAVRAEAAGVAPVREPWHVAELWAPVRPEADVRAARRALAAEPDARALPLVLPDPDEPVLPPVTTWWSGGAAAAAGADDAPVDVPLAPVAGALRAALEAHATQVQAVALGAGAPDHRTSRDRAADTGHGSGDRVVGWYALSNDVLAPLHALERYAVVERRPGASSGSAGTVAR